MTSEMPTAQLHHSIIFLSSFKHSSNQLHDFTLMAGLNSISDMQQVDMLGTAYSMHRWLREG